MSIKTYQLSFRVFILPFIHTSVHVRVPLFIRIFVQLYPIIQHMELKKDIREKLQYSNIEHFCYIGLEFAH